MFGGTLGTGSDSITAMVPSAQTRAPGGPLRQALPGARPFVFYDREENLWHERLLCAPVPRPGEWSWVVPTPTPDQHEEDFGEALELVECGPKNGMPMELYGRQAFRFDETTNKP